MANKYEGETDENLARMMDKAVAEEDYETAAEIKEEIDRRKIEKI